MNNEFETTRRGAADTAGRPGAGARGRGAAGGPDAIDHIPDPYGRDSYRGGPYGQASFEEGAPRQGRYAADAAAGPREPGRRGPSRPGPARPVASRPAGHRPPPGRPDPYGAVQPGPGGYGQVQQGPAQQGPGQHGSPQHGSPQYGSAQYGGPQYGPARSRGPSGYESGAYGREHAGGAATGTLLFPGDGASDGFLTEVGPEPDLLPSLRREPRTRTRNRSTADGHAGNRLFLLLLFWSGLIASVALWWFDNPGTSITGTPAALTAVGRITGMVGGYVLIIQVMMMSRVAWLESWIGSHDLLRWHRQLGGYLFVMINVHVVFTIIGYAGTDKVSVTKETWTMLTTFEDMISAFIATGILLAISLLAIRQIRRRMPYEIWYFVHLTSYLILLLSYGHQFADGADLSTPGAAQWFWGGLYALMLVSLAWGRVIEPVWFNARHRLRVVEVVSESRDMFSVYVGGKNLSDMEVRAGQYFRWRFLTKRGWWQSHPFSLSAAPNHQGLRLTVAEVGDHTYDLRDLRPGTRVFVEGPSGTFTSDRRTGHGALLIAGGSGIAPIRALMEDMPPGTVVIYRARNEASLVFRTELEGLARQRGMQVEYVLGSRHDPGPRHAFTPAGLKELVPGLAERDVYLCGPPGLISAAVKAARKAGVRRGRIHLDPFEF